MSAVVEAGKERSPAGSDVARLVQAMKVRVAFLPTRGSGATPWRRAIVLDTTYRGDGQIRSAASVSLVAHELVHVLQRELGDPEFWPTGGFRPSLSRRWLGDSTNYMEAVAYIVGTSVELDLLAGDQSSRARQLTDWLATVAGEDALNATRAVVKRFRGNSIYWQNYRIEARTPGHRIPAHNWGHWLREIGFRGETVDHIRAQADKGQPKLVTDDELRRRA